MAQNFTTAQAFVPADVHRVAASLDRAVHAAVARRTGGLSPIALGQVWWDRAAHLASLPGRRMELAVEAYLDADVWAPRADRRDGSWWTAWFAARSGTKGQAPAMGVANAGPLCDAPGTYVKQE